MLIASSIWAWRPLEIQAISDSGQTTETPPLDSINKASSQRSPIDLDLFAANLWVEPPPKETPKPATPKRVVSVPPPKLQLIGITTEDGIRYAALYDEKADRLLVVRDGDRIQQFTVASVTDKAVLLKSENRQHTIELITSEPVQTRNGRRS